MTSVLIMFVATFLAVWPKDSETGMIVDPSGESDFEVSMCELVVPRLVEADVQAQGVSVIAGALWAFQMGEDMLHWRNGMTLPLSYEEFYGWVMAACDLAKLVNRISDNDEMAEILMFEVQDILYRDADGVN